MISEESALSATVKFCKNTFIYIFIYLFISIHVSHVPDLGITSQWPSSRSSCSPPSWDDVAPSEPGGI